MKAAIHCACAGVAVHFASALVCTAAALSPLSPAEELKTFHLADPNLVIELVAAEPDVRAPVAVAWDADGRMFVAEMTDYPSGPVGGQIRVLEDMDGDGRCERSTIFATNVAFPNGVMAWKGGVLVTAAPDILFLADTNEDGRADVRERILTGFAEGNQQLRVNGLFWGIDNWIYGANGRSDGEVKWADGTPAGSIRRRDFRFRPDTKQFEAIAGNSQFGMGHDDWGNRFPVFNATPIRHVVIEDRYLARQPSLSFDPVPSISPEPDGNRVFALTPPALLVPQPVGFFTSACGPSIFRGTALPESYRGNYFVCEPVQNLVQRRVLKSNGSTFIAEYADRPSTARAKLSSARRSTRLNGEAAVDEERRRDEDIAALPRAEVHQAPREFLASTDPWFHGVFTATGPDGALYIVDFYREWVEHPQWVAPELRDKVDWRKGEQHGRIWRIRAKGSKAAKTAKLANVLNAELVKALEHDNGWVRDTAHRLLVERKAFDALRELPHLARRAPKPETRIHALNLLPELAGSNADIVLISVGNEEDARARCHYLRLLEPALSRNTPPGVTNLKEGIEQLLIAASNDDAPRVRLQVACTLGELPDKNEKFEALACLARHPELDHWQALAILSSVGARPWALGEKLRPMLATATEHQLNLLERLSGIVGARTNSADANDMLWWLSASTTPNRFVLLAAALESSTPARRAEVAVSFMKSASASATNRTLAERTRIAAIRVVAAGQGNLGIFEALLTPNEPDSVQVAAGKALFDSSDPAAAPLVFSRWGECSKVVRRELIPAAARQMRSAAALLDAVERGSISLFEVDATTRQSLEKSADSAVKQRSVKLFASAVSADREAVVTKFRSALKLAGDRRNGASLFERNCALCHQMQGVGAKIGPDLSGTGQQPRETLLVQILDPSRQVLPDFVAYTAEASDGETYNGFIAAESAASVTLRRPNEPDITLPRSRIVSLKTNGRSLMPDGLEAGMTEQDMADLIEFLRRPDRTLFSLTK